MHNILCFGDSITLGESDLELGGWCDQLKRCYFNAEKGADYLATRVYNLGVPSETTDGLVRRFEGELQSRLLTKQNATIVFQYGINDIVVHKNKNRVPEQYFVANLKNCFEICSKRNIAIVCLSILPFASADDGQENQHGQIRHLKDIGRYNRLLVSLAEQYNGKYIELGEEVSERIEITTAEDGLHPTSEVHKIIYERVKKVLGEETY